MHWVSPAALAWRLLNTLGTDVCIEALEEALARYGRPELFNTCKRCGGASGEDKASPSLETPTGYPMPDPNDLNRPLVALDRDSTLIAISEMSQSTWLVAGIVPGINRQLLKNWWQMRRRCSSCCLAGAPRRPRRAMQSIGSPCLRSGLGRFLAGPVAEGPSGCGEASNTRKSTSTPMHGPSRPRPAWRLVGCYEAEHHQSPGSHAAADIPEGPVQMWTIGFAERLRVPRFASELDKPGNARPRPHTHSRHGKAR